MITDEHYEEIDKLLAKCVDCEDLLTEWENGFVTEWVDKLATYQNKVRITDKQQFIFDRLRSKLEKAGEL